MLRTFNDVSPGRLTTFGLGARVPELIEIDSLESLASVYSSNSTNERRLIGRGSNIILPDLPIDLPLQRFGSELGLFGSVSETFAERLRGMTSQDPTRLQHFIFESMGALESSSEHDTGEVVVFAWAGTSLVSFSRETSYLGISGLEFAAGIPGSVGGAVRMNAGAHGHEVSECLSDLLLFSGSSGFYCRARSELEISYRNGGIPEGSIVVGAIFKFYKTTVEKAREKRRSSLDYRKLTQPLTLPSAGSVFRNPGISVDGEVVSAGWLLEQSDLKGYRIGGVAFSDLHANWLVRLNNEARAADAKELVEIAKCRVKEKYGIGLIEEILFW